MHSVSYHKAVINLLYVAYMFIHTQKKKESHLTVLGDDRWLTPILPTWHIHRPADILHYAMQCRVT